MKSKINTRTPQADYTASQPRRHSTRALLGTPFKHVISSSYNLVASLCVLCYLVFGELESQFAQRYAANCGHTHFLLVLLHCYLDMYIDCER